MVIIIYNSGMNYAKLKILLYLANYKDNRNGKYASKA